MNKGLKEHFITKNSEHCSVEFYMQWAKKLEITPKCRQKDNVYVNAGTVQKITSLAIRVSHRKIEINDELVNFFI